MPIVFNANREIEIVARSIWRRNLIERDHRGRTGSVESRRQIESAKRSGSAFAQFSETHRRRFAEADPESMELLRFAPKRRKRRSFAAGGRQIRFSIGRNDEYQRLFHERRKSGRKRFGERRRVRAMTLSAAEILGVENRLGSLEKGKIANLTVVRAATFSAKTKP
jgi:hypothetical protein